MAKKVQWLPNLRVDVEDLDHATHGYAESLSEDQTKEFVKDFYPRVVDGFRVEIADQSSSPGEFTVVNGFAMDQGGAQILNSEEFNAAASHTLVGDATYYIEVELRIQESDTDARAFWDPNYDNGVDTSGDEIPDGREFAQSVATRLTVDWEIVTPVSTSGFDLSTNASSTKIPIAIVTVAGGEITAPASTTPVRTALARAAGSTDTTIRVLDSRLLPDTGTIDLNPGGSNAESLTITANDRVNGILSLSVGLSNNHSVGEELVQTGSPIPQYIEQRTTHSAPVGTATGDARPRFWQADEETGYALHVEPNSTAGLQFGDNSIKKLKEYVDFIAADLRELKFGASRAEDIGNVAPPSSFAAEPRYFDRSGGILAARTNTVSVGDGVNTWGDFNTTQSGSAQAAIQAALDSVSGGGVVYIKAGTYSITDTAISVTKNVHIIGDGEQQTIIEATDTAEAMIMDGVDAILEELSITLNGGTASYALTSTNNGWSGGAKNCTIHGLSTSTSVFNPTLTTAVFENVFFEGQISGAGEAFIGRVNFTSFIKCSFKSLKDLSALDVVDITSGSSIKFDACSFFTNADSVLNQGTAVHLGSGATLTDTQFVNCIFNETNAGATVFTTTSDVSNLLVQGCHFELDNGLGQLNATTDILIENCSIDVAAAVNAIEIINTARRTTIKNCIFTLVGAPTATPARGILATDAQGVVVNGCAFVSMDEGVTVTAADDVLIESCSFDASTSNRGVAFVSSTGTGSVSDIRILNNRVDGINANTVTTVAAVLMVTAVSIDNIVISNNIFSNIGNSADHTEAYGIRLGNGSGEFDVVDTEILISDNIVEVINASTTIAGIKIDKAHGAIIKGNILRELGLTTINNWHGVNITQARLVVISNNLFEKLGHSSATGTLNGAVFFGSTTSFQPSQNVSIISNEFNSLVNSVTFAAIWVNTHGTGINISNNTILSIDSGMNGIYLVGNLADPRVLSAIVVSNNSVRGSHSRGIHAILVDTDFDDEGRLVISSNIFKDFEATGVELKGPSSGAVARNVVVSNNSLFSDTAAVTGIRLDSVGFATVGNNVIQLGSGSGANIGIDILGSGLTSRFFAVTGNSIYTITTDNAAIGIDCNSMATLADGSICGNVVVMAAGSGSQTAIVGADNTYIAGNMTYVNATSGVNISGGISNARANSDGDADPAVTGTASDIGLNYRRQV